jgi:molybdopterin-synthase adenylyltransferase
MEIVNDSRLNLNRQSFLGAKSSDVLLNTRVAIIGLGGGGSHIAQQLAHIGVGNFLLLDPDKLEDTNLNRLVGARFADVQENAPKVFIAKRAIESVNPMARVVAAMSLWEQQALALQDCEVIFGCIDSLIGRSGLEAFARRYLIPLIDIGMDVHRAGCEYTITGQVALSMPGLPCLKCMGLLRDELLRREAQKYGGAGSRPQVVWPNAILASTAVGLFMQLMTPWFNNKALSPLLEYDGNRQTLQESSKLPYLPARCPHYAHSGNLGDPFWRAGA